jgi:hypothetical protein
VDLAENEEIKTSRPHVPAGRVGQVSGIPLFMAWIARRSRGRDPSGVGSVPYPT